MSDDDSSTLICNKRSKKFLLRRNSVGETDLHVACVKNQIERVRKLLEQGHPINIADNDNWYPLHEACNHGHLPIVHLLLEQNDVNVNVAGGDEKLTPAMDAAANGHYEIVDLLLRKGCDVTKMDVRGDTILEYLQQRSDCEDTGDGLVYLTQLIERVQNRQRELNFKRPQRVRSIPDDSDKSRSERLRSRHRKNFEILTKSRKDGPLNVLEQENFRDYRGTIDKLRKSAKSRLNRTVSLKQSSGQSTKPSLISEKEFRVQQNWLDDDLQIYKKPHSLRDDFSDDDTDENTFEHSRPQRNAKRSKPSLVVSSSSDISDSRDTETVDDDDQSELPPMSPVFNGKFNKSATQKSDVSTGIKTVAQRRNYKRHRRERSEATLPGQDVEVVNELLLVNPSTSSSTSSNTTGRISPKLSTVNAKKIVVRIEDKKMMVPIFDSDLDKSVGWLAQQTAARYNSNYGRKPVVHLCNADSVELCLDDPLNLFLNEELVAQVVSWDLAPLHVKYDQICKKHGEITYTNIKNCLRIACDSGEINLENSGIRGIVARNLFLALQDTYRITLINIRGNRLSAENCSELGKSVRFLTALKCLNLRNTGLGKEHVESFLDGYHSASACYTSNLQVLDLSFNIFEDNSMPYFEKIAEIFPKLERLLLTGCPFMSMDHFPRLFEDKKIDIAR